MEGHSGPQTIENVFQRTHLPTLLGDLQNTNRNQVRTILITDLLTKTSTFYYYYIDRQIFQHVGNVMKQSKIHIMLYYMNVTLGHPETINHRKVLPITIGYKGRYTKNHKTIRSITCLKQAEQKQDSSVRVCTMALRPKCVCTSVVTKIK